jgi:hypothetical protein
MFKTLSLEELITATGGVATGLVTDPRSLNARTPTEIRSPFTPTSPTTPLDGRLPPNPPRS